MFKEINNTDKISVIAVGGAPCMSWHVVKKLLYMESNERDISLMLAPIQKLGAEKKYYEKFVLAEQLQQVCAEGTFTHVLILHIGKAYNPAC